MMLKKLNDILALFTLQQPELTALDIAARLKRPRSSVYRLLSDIAAAGFLDYDERTARYRVGIRLAALGGIAQRSTSLQRLVYPTLVRLSAETQETSTLMVRTGAVGTTIELVEFFQPLMLPGVLGEHPPLHASAGGKVLLAWASASERRDALPAPVKRYTPATITDMRRLHAELDRVREREFSTVRGEWIPDIFGVAAPVRSHDGVVVGAVTIGVPKARASVERLAVLKDSVLRAGAEASLACGFDGTNTHGETRADSRPRPGIVGRAPSGRTADRRRRVAR